mmetsp:Transcript_11522/g.13230  ORF Transcript_11522/g.13230 Transcript_11522/m.13230 type:complete len:225 (-) Transcript_11522:105-779(-)
MVKHKDYFVLTSNVDGCFERSGFKKERLYTPQGDWSLYQCTIPCSRNSYWSSKPMLKTYLDGDSTPPGCHNCGQRVFGNVRGGNWFIHKPYLEQQQRFCRWVMDVKSKGKSLVIVEVGAGFNTPTVTRFAAESIALELDAKFIRINPQESEIPAEIQGLPMPTGVSIIKEIKDNDKDISRWKASEQSVLRSQEATVSPASHIEHLRHHFGHFDWKIFMENLRDQ